jgi:D-glycero-D-manno-heptose 1,7-bisphosphate phosphatase
METNRVANSCSSQKVVFLDRDGTLNVDCGYVHLVEDWKFTPEAEIALQKLAAAGFVLTVVTNQSGIGSGRFSRDEVDHLHSHMLSLLSQSGVSIAAIAVCPHSRLLGCSCRKPKTGLANHIADAIGPIDYRHSWTIGDKPSDIEFGRALQTRTALIRSRYWADGQLSTFPDVVADSLFDAALQIVAQPAAIEPSV